MLIAPNDNLVIKEEKKGYSIVSSQMLLFSKKKPTLPAPF